MAIVMSTRVGPYCGCTRNRRFTSTRPIPADRVQVCRHFTGRLRARVGALRGGYTRFYQYRSEVLGSQLIQNLEPSKTHLVLLAVAQVPHACADSMFVHLGEVGIHQPFAC